MLVEERVTSRMETVQLDGEKVLKDNTDGGGKSVVSDLMNPG